MRAARVTLLLLLWPLTAYAECGYARLTVEGAREEIADTCEALRDVAAYFSRIGVTINPDVTVRFAPAVFIEFFTLGEGIPPVKMQVSGFFDARRKLVEVTSPSVAHRADRMPWRLPWSADIARSILRHELVHVAIHQALGERIARISRSWIEFMAYAVQIELMPENMRKAVLDKYPEATAFESVERINQFIYAYDPDLFGVRAWLFVRGRGGGTFIATLLNGTSDIELGEIFWQR